MCYFFYLENQKLKIKVLFRLGLHEEAHTKQTYTRARRVL